MKKLIFEKIFCKNFRSISNTGITVDLNESPTTLISSRSNGAGKSTMYVHAIYYALFNKAYGEGDKMSSLVNSRNNKEMLVELNFITKGSKYLVRRGAKPSIFEIYKDDILIESEAAKKDYQSYLEVSILGFDEMVFQNSIVLGADRFVPFVDMSASQRREYVEQLMELTVISRMAELAKDTIKNLKREIDNIEHKENNLKTKINAQDKIIANLNDTISRKNASVEDEIAKIVSANIQYDLLIPKFDEKINNFNDSIKSVEYNGSLHNDFKTKIIQAESKLQTLNRDIEKIQHTLNCKECGQSISQEMRDSINKRNLETKQSIESLLETTKPKIEEMDKKFLEVQIHNNNINELIRGRDAIQGTIIANKKQIETFESMKDSSIEKAELIKNENEKKLFAAELVALDEQNDLMSKDLANHLILIEHLKDSGFKSSVIADYVPFLVSNINEYLDSMNLFLNLTMDDGFGIDMNDPTRKGQTLASLSAGQKSRINLAVMFAWRDLSSSKSTCDTNLLVLDEILEKLSATGVDEFFNMYHDKFSDKEMNLVVVSQRADEFETYFDNVVEFKLVDGFSLKCG